MENKFLISVLIPVYGTEKYVEKCISSVLNQTMQEGVEVIIVNDCTPDRSMEKIFEALRAYSEKKQKHPKMTVRIVEHDTNRGLAAVRNTAVNQAKGDYILHVDSDDWIEPDMLEKMYNKAVTEDADIVICDYFIQFIHYKVLFRKTYTQKESYFGEMIAGNHIPLWNKLIKRELYEKYNISAIEGLDAGEDYVTMLPIMYHATRIVYIPYALYHYVKYNPNSITRKMTDKVKRNIHQRVDFAKRFVCQYNLHQYDKELAFLILSEKVRLLEASLPSERKDIKRLWPEADKYLPIFLKNTSLYNRLVLNNHITIAHTLASFKRALKFILRRY